MRFRLVPKSTILDDLEGSLCILFQNTCAIMLLLIYSFTFNLLLGSEWLQRICNLMIARPVLLCSLDLSEHEANSNHSKSHWVCDRAVCLWQHGSCLHSLCKIWSEICRKWQLTVLQRVSKAQASQERSEDHVRSHTLKYFCSESHIFELQFSQKMSTFTKYIPKWRYFGAPFPLQILETRSCCGLKFFIRPTTR